MFRTTGLLQRGAPTRRFLAALVGGLLAVSTVAVFTVSEGSSPTHLSAGGGHGSVHDHGNGDGDDSTSLAVGDDTDTTSKNDKSGHHPGNPKGDNGKDDHDDHDSTSTTNPHHTTTTSGHHGTTTTTTNHHGTTTTTEPRGTSDVDAVAYQLNTQHTGAHTDPALRADLAVLWSHDYGGNLSYPLIVGDAIYFTVAHTQTYGTTLYAVDRDDGHNLWGPIDLGGTYFISGLAYDNGAVFAVNYDGVVQSFDAVTGHRHWTVNVGWDITSPPTARNGVLYIGASTLRALDEATGAVLWSQPVANGDDSGPTVSDDAVYVSYACEQAFAFVAATGAPMWHHATGCSGGGGRNTVLYNGRLYIRDDAGMGPVALDAATGNVVLPYSSWTAPAFSGDIGLFTVDSGVEAHDVATGAILWRYASAQIVSAPLVVNGSVFVGDSAGTVHRLALATGHQTWSGDAGNAMQGPDEHNAWQLTGFAEGRGVLAVEATTRLTIFA